MEPSSSVAGGSGVRTRNRVAAAALTVVAAAGGLAFAQPDDEVGDNTVRVFRDAQFKGKEQVIHPVTAERPYRLHVLDKKLRNKVSSLEWNLPRGVVVVFYDETNGTGRQYVIWGSGRRGALEAADFKKRAAAWVWIYVDGWENAPSEVRGGFSVRPLMTSESKERLAEDTLELHKDVGVRDKGKDLLRIESVTDKPEGVLQPIPAHLDNKVTSLRWNLPPGRVVVLYDNADGTGRRMPLWGDGEVRDLRTIDNRISAWAWYDVVTEKTPKAE
ncbi:MAG: hypothetical protein ACYS1E_12695 [Planctomycetota bacterium]